MADAHEKLLQSLQIIRGQFEDETDDWRYSVLNTFHHYLAEIGIEASLIAPIAQMKLEVFGQMDAARRRAAGKGGGMPALKSVPLVAAAAAVTVLKERGEFNTISESLAHVAKCTGVDSKNLESFRDNLNRGLLREDLANAYRANVAQFKDWPREQIDHVLMALADFVK